jgi:hypothetical protein
VDAFTIMRIVGHSSIVVSQLYVHPTPAAVERSFEPLQLHGSGDEQAVPTILCTVGKVDAVIH